MGISGLKKQIRKLAEECSVEVFEERPLSDFTGYRVAIDISVYLYKFLKSIGEPRWIDAMINLLCVLKKNKLRAVCIFDGPNPPAEKMEEQNDRRSRFAEQSQRRKDACDLKTLIEVNYGMYGKEVPFKLHDQIRNALGRGRFKREKDGLDYSNAASVIKALEQREWSLTKQLTPVSRENHPIVVKEFLDAMGINYIDADGEAETLCAYLAKHKYVDAVLTEDSDILVYGTPLWLCDINTAKETVKCVHFNDVLDVLEMDLPTFRDFCIMCKCDYNKHYNREKTKITMLSEKGKRIGVGPSRALALIKKYGSFEAIEAKVGSIDLTPLRWRRCREIFLTKPPVPKNPVPHLGKIKPEELYLFLRKYDCSIDQDFIEGLWKPVPFVIE